MLVKKWMSKRVITIGPNESAIKASILLKEHNINRLPVIKKGKLVGIVTERDLKRILLFSDTLRVENIMSKEPVTVPWDYTVGETAEIILKHNISGVPVVDGDGQIVGIITKGDLFRALVPLMGKEKKGIQFALLAADRPGAIKEITDIIRGGGGRLMSILTSYEEIPKGYLRVYIRMHGIERKKLQRLREKIGKKASFLYVLDHRDGKREIHRAN